MNVRTLTLMVALLGLIALAGCSENDATNPAATNTASLATADKDAAEAIATDLGSDDGGLVDQISDAVSFAGGVDMIAKSGDRQCEGLRDAAYDETTGTWTITIERERGEVDGVPYASFTRVYTVRFLDELGEPQMRYDVDGSLANTIEFNIVSGSGTHITRRVVHNLDELTGAFVVTDAHTDLVTINGTYLRSGTHSMSNDKFSREHASTLNVELIDVMAPRGSERDMSAAVSGTVTGTYEALITVTRGDDYSEKEIYREFTIELGDGDGVMEMSKKQYRLRLKTGELEGDE